MAPTTKQPKLTSFSRGFTLVETLLVISLFAILIIIAYQALVTAAQAKVTVRSSVAQQAMIRSTHQVLQQAIGSGARIKGSVDQLEIDLRQADTTWLDGVDFLVLTLTENGELRVQSDHSSQTSILLSDLETARFSYTSKGLKQTMWDSVQQPDLVEFSWSLMGRSEQWWFSKQ